MKKNSKLDIALMQHYTLIYNLQDLTLQRPESTSGILFSYSFCHFIFTLLINYV